jgi:tyrosine-protein kinase Etk/Wzc
MEQDNLVQPSKEEQKTVGNNFVEFLTITIRYRWFLFLFVFVITAGATIYALLAPKWYKSTASVLPAENNDFMSAFSGLSALTKNFSPSKGLAALAGNTEFDRYMAILKSSTMIDDVIKKFDLRKEYELESAYYEKVVKTFLSNMELDVQDEGNLTLSIYDKNPQQAANITNYMISRLNKINTNLLVINAKSNREFIEKRYKQNINDIDTLELLMKDFQSKYGVIAVPEQIESTIKSMSEILLEQAKKDIEYNVLKKSYGENNPFTENAKIEVNEINKKINTLINSGNAVDGSNLLIPFKKAPILANKYLKIYRDLEVQYKILEFVQPLYEQAKVEEIRNSPSVLVLDKAVPSDRKSKPKGTIYAMVSFVSSLIVGYFIVFVLVLFQKIKKYRPQHYSFIISSIKKDLRRFRIKRDSEN